MLSLQDAFGSLSTRVPVTLSAPVLYGFPPVVCSFVMAILVLMPHTRPLRVALWLIIVSLTLRGIGLLQISLGTEPEGKAVQTFFVVYMFCMAIRTLDWTLTKEPLVRRYRPANSSPSIIMDALDLATNMRGYGWDWSGKLYIPQETRPQKRVTFVLCTVLSAAVHAFISGVSHQVMQSFIGTGSTDDLTIFDATLPVLLRSLRAGIVTALMGLGACTSMQVHYDLATIVGVVFVRQDPAQWPPAFDAPWRATSLGDFWGRRWHQWYRRSFLVLGGYPLGILLGRTGVVLGSFLASAVTHDVILAVTDSKFDAWRIFAAFGMMAPGILAERAFYWLTGKRVGGAVGWVWTMTWLLLWYSLMLDGFVRAGLVTHANRPMPLGALIKRLVIDFDSWLHSI